MISLLITLVLVLFVCGVALWLLGFLPLDATIKQLIRGLVIIFAVLYCLFVLLTAFGHPVHLLKP